MRWEKNSRAKLWKRRQRKRWKWVSRRWKIYRFFLLLVSFTLVALLLNTTNDDDCFMVVVCCRELEFYNIASISAFSRCRDNNDPLIKDKTCSMLSLFFPFTASTDDYIELIHGIKKKRKCFFAHIHERYVTHENLIKTTSNTIESRVENILFSKSTKRNSLKPVKEKMVKWKNLVKILT